MLTNEMTANSEVTSKTKALDHSMEAKHRLNSSRPKAATTTMVATVDSSSQLWKAVDQKEEDKMDRSGVQDNDRKGENQMVMSKYGGNAKENGRKLKNSLDTSGKSLCSSMLYYAILCIFLMSVYMQPVESRRNRMFVNNTCIIIGSNVGTFKGCHDGHMSIEDGYKYCVQKMLNGKEAKHSNGSKEDNEWSDIRRRINDIRRITIDNERRIKIDEKRIKIEKRRIKIDKMDVEEKQNDVEKCLQNDIQKEVKKQNDERRLPIKEENSLQNEEKIIQTDEEERRQNNNRRKCNKNGKMNEGMMNANKTMRRQKYAKTGQKYAEEVREIDKRMSKPLLMQKEIKTTCKWTDKNVTKEVKEFSKSKSKCIVLELIKCLCMKAIKIVQECGIMISMLIVVLYYVVKCLLNSLVYK